MIADLPVPLQKKLTRLVSRCSVAHRLIEPDDRIMVAFSGGKDSIMLIHLLESIRRIVPFKFEIGVFHLNQSAPDFPAREALKIIESEGFKVWWEDLNTAYVLKEKVPEGDSPCGLCSRLRRGIIYTQANRNGYNKIALGHHREDTLETLMMNLMFHGQIKAMPARLVADNGVNVVIRPMLYVPEELLIEGMQYLNVPISEQTFCTRGHSGERYQTKQLLSELEKSNPNLKGSMLSALHHVLPAHLLDEGLLSRAD